MRGKHTDPDAKMITDQRLDFSRFRWRESDRSAQTHTHTRPWRHVSLPDLDHSGGLSPPDLAPELLAQPFTQS